MKPTRRWVLAAASLVTVVAVAAAGWVFLAGGDLRSMAGTLRSLLGEAPLPEGFAMSNGRLEATEVDVATKLARRLVHAGPAIFADRLRATHGVRVPERLVQPRQCRHLHRGAGFDLVWPHLAAILAIGVVAFTAALARFRQTVSLTRL